eukprot:2401474-Pyramimonas_sp.AAC.1
MTTYVSRSIRVTSASGQDDVRRVAARTIRKLDSWIHSALTHFGNGLGKFNTITGENHKLNHPTDKPCGVTRNNL